MHYKYVFEFRKGWSMQKDFSKSKNITVAYIKISLSTGIDYLLFKQS